MPKYDKKRKWTPNQTSLMMTETLFSACYHLHCIIISTTLEHTSQLIDKLEKELEEYLKHLALYKKAKEGTPKDSII
jgi:hypothetical protein